MPECRQRIGGSPEEKGILLPELSCRTAAELLRGQLGGSPSAQEYNPLLLHVAVQYGLQRFKAKVPVPQFFSTMAEISPTTSLNLLWKYKRRQTQSL